MIDTPEQKYPDILSIKLVSNQNSVVHGMYINAAGGEAYIRKDMYDALMFALKNIESLTDSQQVLNRIAREALENHKGERMMVGGKILSKAKLSLEVMQLWCIEAQNGSTDECAVDVLIETDMPMIGDEIWWQAGKVYWDKDRKHLTKVGNSYDPTKEGE